MAFLIFECDKIQGFGVVYIVGFYLYLKSLFINEYQDHDECAEIILMAMLVYLKIFALLLSNRGTMTCQQQLADYVLFLSITQRAKQFFNDRYWGL
jgi:hypothetical protein